MRAPLVRSEAGVTAPRDQQREVVRLLYFATRHQVQALVAVFELKAWNDAGTSAQVISGSQSCSASRLTAGASGFFTFNHKGDRSER